MELTGVGDHLAAGGRHDGARLEFQRALDVAEIAIDAGEDERVAVLDADGGALLRLESESQREVVTSKLDDNRLIGDRDEDLARVA
jgi:hypothetical protein